MCHTNLRYIAGWSAWVFMLFLACGLPGCGTAGAGRTGERQVRSVGGLDIVLPRDMRDGNWVYNPCFVRDGFRLVVMTEPHGNDLSDIVDSFIIDNEDLHPITKIGLLLFQTERERDWIAGERALIISMPHRVEWIGYRNLTAAMLSEKVFTNMEGDIRVKGDTIVITYYKDHEILGLREKYHNISQQLENENISPKIPWLYDYKLEFRFK
jgi:hypothetical protein